MISIYRPPSQNSEYFLNNLTEVIHFFADTYDKYLIMGDLIIEQSDPSLKTFLNSNNLYNLIKSNTCFKDKSSCNGLFLANRKYSFKFSGSYETGITDHHHMIYTAEYKIDSSRTAFIGNKINSKNLYYETFLIYFWHALTLKRLGGSIWPPLWFFEKCIF